MFYVIMGRTGSGKSLFARKLQRLGLKFAVTSTTRKPREAGEHKYHFLTPEQAAAVPETDKLAKTELNGNEYFLNRFDLYRADAIVLEPSGLEDLCSAIPDTEVAVIYLASPREDRKERALLRGSDKISLMMEFNSRDLDEDLRFTKFEESIGDESIYSLCPNLNTLWTVGNDAKTPESVLDEKADGFARYFRSHVRLAEIVKQCGQSGAIDIADGKTRVVIANSKGDLPHEEWLPIDRFTERVMSDDGALAAVTRAWLATWETVNCRPDFPPAKSEEVEVCRGKEQMNEF